MANSEKVVTRISRDNRLTDIPIKLKWAIVVRRRESMIENRMTNTRLRIKCRERRGRRRNDHEKTVQSSSWRCPRLVWFYSEITIIMKKLFAPIGHRYLSVWKDLTTAAAFYSHRLCIMRAVRQRWHALWNKRAAILREKLRTRDVRSYWSLREKKNSFNWNSG